MKSLVAVMVMLCGIVAGQAQISFEASAGQHTKGFRSGVAVMVTDANGDGRDDIIRMDNGDFLTVTLQGQDGRFISTYFWQIAGSEQWNITGGDIDNDGGFDIITSGAYDRVKIFRPVPFASTYNNETIDDQTFFAQASNVVDINNDGFLDLFICNDDQKSVIFMNDQAGQLVRDNSIIDFTTAVPSDNSGNYGSIWTDFDSDGDLDLYIAKCRQGVNDPSDPRRINALYLNNGDNTFTESADSFQLAISAQSWTADFGDIDNDGDFDLFVTNHDVPGMLLENIDNEYFDDITDDAGVVALGIQMQGTFRDFDNDGMLDLLITGTTNYLYRNVGGNQFEAVENPTTDRPMTSYGLGDLNSDGFLDIYASYNELFNGPHPILDDVIWMNTGNANGYVTVHLTGTTSNASGVGARLYLYGSWGAQTREVRAGEGYGITNSLTQHFGVGTSTLVDSLVVIWPNGVKEVFPELGVNKNFYLEEGKCLTELLHFEDGPFTQCGVGAFTFSAPDGYAEYLWSNGATTQEITAFEPGIYHVSMTDDQSCTWIAGPLIISFENDTEPDEVTVAVEGRLITCAGSEILLSAPDDAVSYLWSNGETTAFIIPDTDGIYAFEAVYPCNSLFSDTVQVTLVDPNALIIENDTILGGGAGELTAEGDSVIWYADPDGLNVLGTGSVLITPDVDTTTAFYAQQTLNIPGESARGGQPDFAGVSFYNNNMTNGALRFDVLNRVRIDSVLVRTTWVGERTIVIVKEFEEDTVYRETFFIDTGRTYLPLNVWLEPGADYLMSTDVATNQATFGLNTPRLYRSDRMVLYPYAIPDVLSINSTASSQQFYYYFYDWHVTREDQYCVGDLIPAQVVVIDTTSSATFTQNVEPLDLHPNPANTFIEVGDAQFLAEAIEVSVIDARGLQIGAWQMDKATGRLLISGLADGMYFLRVVHRDQTYLGQFVKMQ